MRWALLSRFEHSNRERLALSLCRDMTVFVVHKGSLEVPRGPRGFQGVPGASLGGLRDVPEGSQGRPWGSQGRPRGSQGRAQGIRGIPGSSRDVPGIPWILFIKMIPDINSIISFHDKIP